MTPIIKYLENEELSPNKVKARAMKRWVVHYAFKFEQLYKWGYFTTLKMSHSRTWPICNAKIHKGVCGNHFGPHLLLHKVVQ